MTAPRKRAAAVLQAALALLVVCAVGWHFATLLNRESVADAVATARPGPLLAAAGCYLLAHAVWATFFWQLLRSQGAGVSWFVGVRAYFVSQAGKYVPGKAWVILIRVLMLRRHGLSPAVVGVCGLYETLTSMAAGAGLGVALLPWSGSGFAAGGVEWVAFLALAALPVALGLSNGLLVRLIKRLKKSDSILPRVPVWLLALGLAQAAVGWGLLGFALALALAGLVPDPAAVSLLDPRGVVAAVALSYVAGFAALFLPAGFGARDLLLQRMLAAQLPVTGVTDPASVAAVTAVTVRLVWTVAEVLLAAGLYWAGRSRAERVPAGDPELAAAAGGAA